MILVDTNAIIDYLKGEEKAKKYFKEAHYMFYITTLNEFEILLGLEHEKIKKPSLYNDRYRIWVEFRGNCKVLKIGSSQALKGAEVYNTLEQQGKKIPKVDALILGTMLTNGIAKILTKDKHFEYPGIEIIDYSK
ncbi:MAG: type II toxin-antitoxin system VapC family toxin [Promethearchaeota archaeon]